MLTKETINLINQSREKQHLQEFESLAEKLTQEGIDVKTLLGQLEKFQIAVPSWALGAGGTRFGRFAYGGAPRTLLEKIEDVGLLHALTKNSNAISLHIPWDIPKDIQEIKEAAIAQQLSFDAVNSNTFQDQVNQKHSYKYGSLSHADKAVREQAIAHNKEVVQIGESLGSKSITVWLADGSNFPGQNNFQKALQRTQDSLQEITKSMPKDWRLFIECKPYEPHFYSCRSWSSHSQYKY